MSEHTQIKSEKTTSAAANKVLPLQNKLTVGSVNDPLEHEADAVADKVMRMPEQNLIQRKCSGCKDEDENVQRKPLASFIQKMGNDSGMTASDSVTQKINSTRGGGSNMDNSTKSFMESRFGTDFSSVKIHTGDYAVQMSQELNAQAFTVGNDVYFNSDKYNPNSDSGKYLLAHELTHTVQQNNSLHLKPLIQRTTIADFRRDLEVISSNHSIVIRELFAHPKFIPLINYLSRCPAGTIDFRVTRIQERVRGRLVDLFGGFNPPSGSGAAELTVNPFRPEHATNPLEVVDTIVHECLHAILDLNSICTSSSNPFPLAANVLDAPHDPELNPLFAAGGGSLERSSVASLSSSGVTAASGANVQEFLQNNYGPSASRPETHFVDLNRQGLELVKSIIADIKAAHPGIGQETVSFDNVELMQAADLLSSRSWLNSAQQSYSSGLFKDQVANKRKIETSTFTEREYSISAIQVVEFSDSAGFDPNTHGGWGFAGGVWQFNKRSRFTGRILHTYVTGTSSNKPGGSINYRIIQHT